MILTPDNEYAAVLDACVLAPMPLCDTLLRCAEEPALFRVLWSTETLEEVRRTLIKFGLDATKAARRVEVMREAFPEAEVTFPPRLLEGTPDLPDQNDRHVAAAAIHEKANVIVTANLRDFPEALFAPHGIYVSHPDDFLVHQFHLNEERLLEALETQACGIGQHPTAVLDRLRRDVPKLVQLASQKRW